MRMNPAVVVEAIHEKPSPQHAEPVLPLAGERAALPHLVLLAIVYFWATWFTNAHYMADSGGYVVSILAFDGIPEYVLENPLARDHLSENPFWDAGHLFWRPLGLGLLKTAGRLSSLVVGPAPNINVLVNLIALNLAAGLACVLLLHGVMRHATGRVLPATIVTTAFIFSHAFLNFAQTASPYVTGLALVLAGVYVLQRAGRDAGWLPALAAGLAFASAVWLWLLYVLIVGAAIAVPLVLGGFDRGRVRLVFRTGLAFTLLTGAGYAAVMLYLGIHTPAELRAWIAAASHGVNTNGLTRAVFGLSRSLINTDQGILFKRYLLRDPFNPVSTIDLFTQGAGNLILFYLALGSILAVLWKSKQRHLLVMLVLGATPLGLFATLYDGGAVERYLPIYPFFFLALAGCLAASRVSWQLKLAPAALIAVLAVTNISTLAAGSLNRRQERTTARIQELLPELRYGSYLVTSHLQDDLVFFQAGFPFHPVNQYEYRLYPLVAPNTAQAAGWREHFATRVADVWEQEADVWISTRLRIPEPRPEWNWAEGDDPRVSWKDLYAFFSELQVERTVGGEDGFVLLVRSAVNARLLAGRADRDAGLPAVY